MKPHTTGHRLGLPALIAALCLATSATHAATLTWGSGSWGTDTWAGGGTVGGGLGTLPPTLPGAAFHSETRPATDTAASFAIGVTRDGGQTWLTRARVGDSVTIVGYLYPESQHIGQKADVFVVDRLNLAFRMKNQLGLFIPWDARVAHLVPLLEDLTLSDSLRIEIYTGALGVSGEHEFYLGYMASDGVLRYTPTPLRISIAP